jgi:hypothetical protein
VGAETNGTIMLENLSLNNADAETGYAALEIMQRAAGGAYVVMVRGTVSLAGAGEGFRFDTTSGAPARTLNIILYDGASLTIRGGAGYDGIYCNSALAISGTGTVNTEGGDSADAPAGRGIAVHKPLAILRDVRVTARGGDHTGDSQADSGGNDGVYCRSTLLVEDHAKLDATGGSSLGDGCHGGNGVFMENYYPTRQGAIKVTSDAPGALTCTGGVGRVVNDQHGNGITANLSPLTLDGTGEIKAVGDHGIAAFGSIGITGGKITAEGQDAGYGLYAGYGGSSEWVSLIGGAVTAFNRDTANHAYYKFLNQSGGTLNTTPPAAGSGGGAPTPLVLALLAALLALRAQKSGTRFRT